jgi:AcrR family transcriptional regulator
MGFENEDVGMPRPRARLDHAAIAAAFAPDGLHGVRADEVARRAGVAKPTLYAHGRSKEAVFLACVEAEAERLLARLYDADVGTRELGVASRAAALTRAVIEHAAAHPEAARLLHVTARHATSAVASDVDATLDRVPARIAEALRRDLEDDRAETVATMLHGAAVALALRPPPDPAGAAAMLGQALAAVVEPAGREEHVTLGFY